MAVLHLGVAGDFLFSRLLLPVYCVFLFRLLLLAVRFEATRHLIHPIEDNLIDFNAITIATGDR